MIFEHSFEKTPRTKAILDALPRYEGSTYPLEWALRELAAAEIAMAEAKREALRLAQVIWRSEYQREAPEWRPLDSIAGIISQIDNMYAGVRNERDKLLAQVNWCCQYASVNTLAGANSAKDFESQPVTHKMLQNALQK